MKRDDSLKWQRRAVESLELGGLSAIVVGGTGGIGRAFARTLASRGAQVTVVGRTFRDADTPRIKFVAADLSSMLEAKRIARALPVEATALLIFTTGIIAGTPRQETDEGIERDMAVSYLNRLVMMREMAPRLGRDHKGHRPRVFVVGFPGAGHVGDPDDLSAERGYQAWPAHLNTVAANEALVLDAARRHRNLAVFGLNPGIIKSNIRSNFWGGFSSLVGPFVETLLGWCAPSLEDYALQLTPLLVAPEIADRSGAMFDRKGHTIHSSVGITSSQAERFQQASTKLVDRASRSACLQREWRPSSLQAGSVNLRLHFVAFVAATASCRVL